MRRCKAHPDRHALEGVCAGLFRNQLPWFSFDVCFSFALFSATDGLACFHSTAMIYLLLTLTRHSGFAERCVGGTERERPRERDR